MFNYGKKLNAYLKLAKYPELRIIVQCIIGVIMYMMTLIINRSNADPVA